MDEKDLSQDIEKVDSIFGKFVEADLGTSLTKYYRTDYRRMNWHIHSGMASTTVNPLEIIPAEMYDITCAFAFKWSANLAFLCHKVILSDFQFTTAIDDLLDQCGLLEKNSVNFFSEHFKEED